MTRPAPRGADWFIAAPLAEYVPLDHAQRAASAESARRDVAWPIPLTRVGTPPITERERRLLWPEPA